MAERAPFVCRMLKVALARSMANRWVFAHTIRTGVTMILNADEPSLSTVPEGSDPTQPKVTCGFVFPRQRHNTLRHVRRSKSAMPMVMHVDAGDKDVLLVSLKGLVSQNNKEDVVVQGSGL